MTLEKIKKQSKYILILFMILQPIFDIYYLYSDNVIAFFKFSPSTILRMLFIIYLGVTSYLLIRKEIKPKYLIIFLFVYFLYTILHLYNATLFDSSILKFQNYSFAKEVFYLIRMFCPLMLIMVLYEKDLTFADLKKIIISVYLIFAVTMIVTNLFEVALTSYADGDKIIKANFLRWFEPGIYEKIGYEYLASKGIFHMANQVSGVMTMLLPFLLYIIFKERFKLLNIVTLFLTMLSMLMLGTRIASLGMILVIVAAFILHLFFEILEKKKLTFQKTYLFVVLFIVLALLFYPKTPVANRVYMEDSQGDVHDNIKKSGADVHLKNLKAELETLTDKEEIRKKKSEFLENYYEIYGIDALYINNLYTYQDDTDFWFDMLDVPFQERADHRQLKKAIMTRVYNLNDNKLDNFVGYSFTRPRNATIYMENDIYVHFFTIGIIGIILFLLPYLGIVIYAFIAIIKNHQNFNYLNLTLIFSIVLTYLIGYLTGNIFDEWLVTLFLGFITGLLLNNIKKSKN